MLLPLSQIPFPQIYALLDCYGLLSTNYNTEKYKAFSDTMTQWVKLPEKYRKFSCQNLF